MKENKLHLTSEYVELLDIFCNKLSLAEPDEVLGNEFDSADVVKIRITKEEAPQISLSSIMRLDNFFKETGISVYGEPFPDNQSELDATYYEWDSIRPNWYADWYKKYQKIRFFDFTQLLPHEVIAVGATLQIIYETTIENKNTIPNLGQAIVPEGYVPKSDERLVSYSSNSLDDFYGKVQASYKKLMELNAIKSYGKNSKSETIVDYDKLLLNRCNLALQKTQKDGYINFTGKSVLESNIKTTIDKPKLNPSTGYRITLLDRQIILNDLFLISRPDSFGENEVFFEFLYNNPNKAYSKEEIEEATKESIGKDFSKILENLNFKKDLRKLFFKVSNKKIMFRNPVSVEEAKALGIDFAKITPK